MNTAVLTELIVASGLILLAILLFSLSKEQATVISAIQILIGGIYTIIILVIDALLILVLSLCGILLTVTYRTLEGIVNIPRRVFKPILSASTT